MLMRSIAIFKYKCLTVSISLLHKPRKLLLM